MKVQIQSGAVEVRSDEFGNDDFEGLLTDVHTIHASAYSGNPGYDFLSFEKVSDRIKGELTPLDSGRGARDFTIHRLTKLD